MTLTWLEPSTLEAWRSSGGSDNDTELGEQQSHRQRTASSRELGPSEEPEVAVLVNQQPKKTSNGSSSSVEAGDGRLNRNFGATGRIKMDQVGGVASKRESVTLVALNLLERPEADLRATLGAPSPGQGSRSIGAADFSEFGAPQMTSSTDKMKTIESDKEGDPLRHDGAGDGVFSVTLAPDKPTPPTSLDLRTTVVDSVSVNFPATISPAVRYRGVLPSPSSSLQPSCFHEEDEDREEERDSFAQDNRMTPTSDTVVSPRHHRQHFHAHDTHVLSKSLNSGGAGIHAANTGTMVTGAVAAGSNGGGATSSGFSFGSCWPSGSASSSSSSSSSSESSAQLPPRFPRRRTPSLPADPSLSGLAHKKRDDILLHCSLQRLPMKDFGAEVRASMDVDQFLNQAVLLLDVQDTSVEGIVDRMLHKVLDSLDSREPLATMTEAKEALFAHDSGDTEIGKNHVHLLGRTIQGTYISEGGGFDYDQSWICAMCGMPSLLKRHVAIARLKHPANMGRTSHEVRFFIMVLTPSKEKGTKNALETGRTFATIFADMDFRQRLLEVHTEAEFKNVLLKHAQDLAAEQSNPTKRLGNHDQVDFQEPKCRFAQGLYGDTRRRIAHYFSDYIDGFKGHRTIQKTVSTTLFLYFACLLPTIAFGVLNDTNTHGKIGDVRKSIIGQAIGGLIFATIAGQPLVIVMTTAPLSLYIKVIHGICEDFQLNFFAMYACVGLWNTLFLILYAIFDASKLMKWSTRSTEEIFALFISIAFAVDAGKDMYRNFRKYYYSPACTGEMVEGSMVGDVVSAGGSNQSVLPVAAMLAGNLSLGGLVEGVNGSAGTEAVYEEMVCKRENSLLFLLLMLGTVWLAISLYNFNKTPYLQASRREMLADCALPVAVILLSFIGSYVFKEIKTDHFRYTNNYPFVRAPVEELPWTAAVAAMGLGFALSLLFFMDQNISAAMVNNPCNKLKKGPAYHLDLLVVGLINGFLSIYGFPWMHGVLPHSPLHVRSLADVEERVDQGHVYEIIVKVRETRITGIVSHILIGLSVFLLPLPLAWIPTPVLYGLFLYMALTSLNGNQMFERITLLFMEQAAYPPNHYIRRCPQRKIHLFTICQVVQLSIMCFFGFAPWPYVEMVFPVVILLLLPFRQTIVPYIINEKYLEALDGENQ